MAFQCRHLTRLLAGAAIGLASADVYAQKRDILYNNAARVLRLDPNRAK